MALLFTNVFPPYIDTVAVKPSVRPVASPTPTLSSMRIMTSATTQKVTTTTLCECQSSPISEVEEMKEASSSVTLLAVVAVSLTIIVVLLVTIIILSVWLRRRTSASRMPSHLLAKIGMCVLGRVDITP